MAELKLFLDGAFVLPDYLLLLVVVFGLAGQMFIEIALRIADILLFQCFNNEPYPCQKIILSISESLTAARSLLEMLRIFFSL